MANPKLGMFLFMLLALTKHYLLFCYLILLLYLYKIFLCTYLNSFHLLDMYLLILEVHIYISNWEERKIKSNKHKNKIYFKFYIRIILASILCLTIFPKHCSRKDHWKQKIVVHMSFFAVVRCWKLPKDTNKHPVRCLPTYLFCVRQSFNWTLVITKTHSHSCWSHH